MAKYIIKETKISVYDTKEKQYQMNFILPFLNLLAGIVWSIPLLQKVFSGVEGIASLGIAAVFVLLYLLLSALPVVSIVPCIAGGIIYTVMLWGIADHIGYDVVRIIVKIVALLLAIFVEFSVFVNATLGWLQKRHN